MSPKKTALMTLLSICSASLGALLGLLDVFGFIDGRHAISLTLLGLAALFFYITLVSTFLLHLTDKKRLYIFVSLATSLFTITFYIAHAHLALTLIAGLSYFLFLRYAYISSIKRSEMFIRFSPREVFFPILKNGFTYFLIIIALLAYSQSQRLVSENSLISPSLIRTISKPTVAMLNQQINSQFSPMLSSQVVQSLPESQRNEVIVAALDQTVQSLVDPRKKTVYGIQPRDIPVRKVHINPSGTVDITPMIEAMLPTIAFQLNQAIKGYAIFAPFGVALLVFLLFQPIIIPLQLFETYMTLVIFKILRSTRFLQIKSEPREVEIPYI